VNLVVRTSIDGKEQNLRMYFYLQLVDSAKYILEDIFICIINGLCSDQGENQ